MADKTYTFPPPGANGEGQGHWDAPRARHNCEGCELDASFDAKTLTLAYVPYGAFDTSADASAAANALRSKYDGTDPASLGDDDAAGAQDFYVNDLGEYGEPDEDGVRTYTPGADVSPDFTGPGAVPFSGAPYGEFPIAESDYDLGDLYAYLGNYTKAAIRFRVTFAPAWRAVDAGASIKVEYRLRTYAWVKDGVVSGRWVRTLDEDGNPNPPTLGATQTATLTAPAVGALTAAASAWIAIEGSSGQQKTVEIIRAYVDRKCRGD